MGVDIVEHILWTSAMRLHERTWKTTTAHLFPSFPFDDDDDTKVKTFPPRPGSETDLLDKRRAEHQHSIWRQLSPPQWFSSQPI